MGKLKKIDIKIPDSDTYQDDTAGHVIEPDHYDDTEYEEPEYDDTEYVHQNNENEIVDATKPAYDDKIDLDLGNKDTDGTIIQTDQETRKSAINGQETYINTLSKPARLLTSSNEQHIFYNMRLERASVNNMIKKRLMMTIVTAVVAIIIAVVASAKIYVIGGAAIVVPLAVWFLASKNTNRLYSVYKFNRQLNFTKFCRLLIPYLKKMKQGASLYQLLSDVSKRLDDPKDQNLVRTLMIEIANRPGDEEPFVQFARDFSGTDRAELFMLAVFDMSQGSYNDGVVKDLGRQASNDLMTQIDSVVDFKLSKFNNVTTWLTMCSAIMLLGYFAALISSIMSQALSQM